MLVISDSSPLIALINIKHVHILRSLFDRVVLPESVHAELSSQRRPLVIQQFAAQLPVWITLCHPTHLQPLLHLDIGERDAISLAAELHADLILIDEKAGRQAAINLGLKVSGTIGLLELAAKRKLLNLTEAFEALKQTDFWIAPEFLDERLQQFNAKRESP